MCVLLHSKNILFSGWTSQPVSLVSTTTSTIMRMIARSFFTHRTPLFILLMITFLNHYTMCRHNLGRMNNSSINFARTLETLTGKKARRNRRKFSIREIITSISSYSIDVFRLPFANWRFCLQDYHVFSRSPSPSELSDDVFSIVEEWRFGGRIGRRKQWAIVFSLEIMIFCGWHAGPERRWIHHFTWLQWMLKTDHWWIPERSITSVPEIVRI